MSVNPLPLVEICKTPILENLRYLKSTRKLFPTKRSFDMFWNLKTFKDEMIRAHTHRPKIFRSVPKETRDFDRPLNEAESRILKKYLLEGKQITIKDDKHFIAILMKILVEYYQTYIKRSLLEAIPHISSPMDCCICFEEIPENYSSLTGGCPIDKHKFHTQCILRWDKSTCPLCRQELADHSKLREMVKKMSMFVYLTQKQTVGLDDSLKAWILGQLGQPDEIISELPECDANTIGLEFFEKIPANLMVSLVAFVFLNHDCDESCDEPLCFVKMLFLL